MKVRSLILSLAAVMGLTLASCDNGGQNDDGGGETPSALVLDQPTVLMFIGEEIPLKATFGDQDVTASAEWTSSNEAVATVSAGVITGVGAGSATITCTYNETTATSQVTVGQGQADMSYLLEGSSYYIMQMGETAYNKIADKVVADMRSNGAFDESGNLVPTGEENPTRVNYLWDQGGGVTGNAEHAVSGPNCFGEADGWFALAVANDAPWGNCCGGLGIGVADPVLNKLQELTPDHKFVIVLKGKYTESQNLVIKGQDASGTQVDLFKIAESTGPNKDGGWQAFEVSVEDMISAGCDITAPQATDLWYSWIFVLTGAGNTLDVDVVMFYLPAE